MYTLPKLMVQAGTVNDMETTQVGRGIYRYGRHHYPIPASCPTGLLGELARAADGSTIVQQTHRGPYVGDRRGDSDDSPLDLEFKVPKVRTRMVALSRVR